VATEKEFEAETEREALELACTEFGVSKDGLDYTIVDMGSAGLFGMGARPVKIKASAAGTSKPAEKVSAPKAAPKAEKTEKVEKKEVAKPKEEAPEAEAEAEAEADSDESSSTQDRRPERPPALVGPAPEKAAQAKEVAAELAAQLKMDAEIEVRDEEEEIVIVLTEKGEGTDVADVLGSTRPPALPSFQFLLNKIVNRFPENRKHILVEAESVSERIATRKAEAAERRKQNQNRPPKSPPDDIDEEMMAIARRLVEKANAVGKVITILPMSAGDRRAIHQTVMTIEDADTVSEGDGLFRRIHVVPDALRNKRPGRRRRRGSRGRRPEEEAEANSESEQAASSAEETQSSENENVSEAAVVEAPPVEEVAVAAAEPAMEAESANP